VPVNTVADAEGDAVGLVGTTVSLGDPTGGEETGTTVGFTDALLGVVEGFTVGAAAVCPGDGVIDGLGRWLGVALADGLGTGAADLVPGLGVAVGAGALVSCTDETGWLGAELDEACCVSCLLTCCSVVTCGWVPLISCPTRPTAVSVTPVTRAHDNTQPMMRVSGRPAQDARDPRRRWFFGEAGTRSVCGWPGRAEVKPTSNLTGAVPLAYCVHN
jgi:hypothetical protein